MATTMEKIAHNLKKYRLARNISQHELSRQSGVSNCILNWIESGKRDNVTINTLERIAKPLNIKLLDLLHGKD